MEFQSAYVPVQWLVCAGVGGRKAGYCTYPQGIALWMANDIHSIRLCLSRPPA